MTLTPAQTYVVNATEPYLLVSACPGAGKSRVLVERIVRLVGDGVDPARIAVITFTGASAKVLSDRFAGENRRIHTSLGEGPMAHGGSAPVQTLPHLGFAGTLHGWCFGLLARYGDLIGLTGPLSIIDEDGQADLVAEAAQDMAWKGSVKELILEIAKGPVNRTFPLSMVGIAAHAFFQRLAADRILTFDMILCHGLRLLESQPGVADADYLFVDEANDLSDMDWKIIDAARVPNVFVVGDPDQRIMSFRGASDEFEKRCKMKREKRIKPKGSSRPAGSASSSNVMPVISDRKPMQCWRCNADLALRPDEPCPHCGKTDQLHEDLESE